MPKKEALITIVMVFLILAMAGSVLSANDSSIVLYLPFDEGNGATASDISGNGNNGTIYGATWTAGKVGNALSFDGINDLVSIPDSANWDFSNHDFTINFWANFKSLDTGKGAMSILDQFYDVRAWVIGYDQLGSTGNGGLYFRYSTDGTSVNKDYAVAWSPAIGSWYQITAIRSGSNINLYINGAQIGSDFNSGTDIIYNSNEALWIGCAHTGAGGDASGYCFNGTIDEVSIYNRALSSSEVQQLYGAVPTNISQNTTPEKPPASITNLTCTDSDGGINYYTAGKVDGVDETGYNYSYPDLCEPSPNSTKIILKEMYCSNNKPYSASPYDCPNGCLNGVCINVTTPPPINATCTDSDGGMNYTVRGLTSAGATRKWDRCIGTTRLTEYYCLNSTVASIQYNCPFRCSVGACAVAKKGAQGVLAKTGQAFGLGGTAGAGVFAVIAVLVLLLIIYLLMRRK